MHKLRSALLIAVLCLSACSGGQAPGIAELRLTDYPGLAQVQTRSFYDEGKAEDGTLAPAPIRNTMHQAGIRSAAQFRYHIVEGDSGTILRARVEMYRDDQQARELFRSRHLPQALENTETLNLADDAFAFNNEYLGFLSGRVIVEIRAKPPHPALRPFAERYASFVETRMNP